MFLICISLIALICPSGWANVEHVVLISFDGLRPDAISQFENKLPHFRQLIQEGVSTFNARTDVDFTVTLPNHTCMLTSRGVAGAAGHGVTLNMGTKKTVHELKGEYVKSIFDVLHEHKLSSVMDASKLKFKIYADSYPIDRTHLTDQQDSATMAYALKDLKEDQLPTFLFIHFSNPDFTGHHRGWSVDAASSYIKAVFKLDDYLGQIMAAIRTFNEKGKSIVLIVTSDHGGTGLNHDDPKDKRNYTIPFLVWGTNVAHGQDLYELNKNQRFNPGERQIAYKESQQPIRNGEAANLALHLLGLPCVPQSTIGCAPGLIVEDLRK